MSESPPPIDVKQDGAIATITIDRPGLLNALGNDVLDEIEHILRRSHFVGNNTEMQGHSAKDAMVAQSQSVPSNTSARGSPSG